MDGPSNLGVGLLFSVRTIVPHNSISRSWERDRGHVLSTWGIVFDVTVASQECQMFGNKCVRFDSLPFLHALS